MEKLPNVGDVLVPVVGEVLVMMELTWMDTDVGMMVIAMMMMMVIDDDVVVAVMSIDPVMMIDAEVMVDAVDAVVMVDAVDAVVMIGADDVGYIPVVMDTVMSAMVDDVLPPPVI